MARKPIGINLDDNDMNNTNSNFIELYGFLGFISDAKNKIDDFLKGDLVVSTQMIQDGAIKNIKIANDSISSGKLQYHAVTPDKTTFFDIDKNVFDGNYVNGMITHDFETNELVLRNNFNDFKGKVAIVPIEPNESYTITVDNVESNILRVGTHSSDIGIRDGARLDYLHFTSSAGDDASSASVRTRHTDKFIYIYVSNEGKTPSMTVAKSKFIKAYLPELSEGEVDVEHVSFINMSENIFNSIYEDGMLVAMTEEKTLAPTQNYENYKGKTAIVKVNPNSAYSIKIDSDKSNVVRVGSSQNVVDFGEYPTDNRLDNLLYSGTASNSIKELMVTVPEGDKYLYVYVSNNGSTPEMSIKKHEIESGLIGRPHNIKPNETSFFEEEHPNLFNGQYYNGIVTYDRNSNLMYFRKNYGEFLGKTAIIPVKPNTTYSVKVHDTPTSEPFRIALHNSLPIPLSTEEQSPDRALNTFVYEGYTLDKKHTFTTGPQSKYALIYVANDGQTPLMKFEEGDVNTIINGKYIIPSKYLPGSSENSGNEADNSKDYKFVFPGEFNKIHKMEVLENHHNTSDAYLMNERFIELVDENKDIASSTLLTTDDLGNKIYKFESKPLDYKYTQETGSVKGDTGETIRVPKVIITGAVHGSERGVPHYLYHFLKELLQNPTNNETVKHLRQNVHFIIAPLVNPSGFNANTYNNLNDVNLNRDFPPYGTVTQKESQAIKELIDKNSDADFLFDAHNMFARDGLIGYSRTDDKGFQHTATNTFKAIGSALQGEHEYFPQDRNHRWAFSGIANVGTIGKYAQDELGIPSALYEVPRGLPFGSHTNYDEPITRYGAELTMNLIFSAISSRQ